MKNFVLGFAAVLGAASCAAAADLPTKAPVRAAAGYNWTGCYIGAYGGGAFRGRSINANDPQATSGIAPVGTFYNGPTANAANGGAYNYDLSTGGMAGGTLGCNWQAVGSQFVWGVEADGGWLRLNGSAVDPYSIPAFGSDTTSTARIGNWDATLTARGGIAFDRVLFYAKGGVGFSRIEATFTDNCLTGGCGLATLNAAGSKNIAFWVAGGGVEWAFANNWSVKGEYLYLGIHDSLSACGPVGGSGAGTNVCGTQSFGGDHTAKLGLNYKFDWGGPIVARY